MKKKKKVTNTNRAKHRRARRKKTLDEMRARGYVCPEEAASMVHMAQSTIYKWMGEEVLTDIITVGRRAKFIGIANLKEVAGLVEDENEAA